MSTNAMPDAPDVRYDSSTESYWMKYDWEGEETLTVTVLTAVARIEGKEGDSWEFEPPLLASINPDALNALFEPYMGKSPSAYSGVWFDVDGYTITVSSNGTIEISPPS